MQANVDEKMQARSRRPRGQDLRLRRVRRLLLPQVRRGLRSRGQQVNKLHVTVRLFTYPNLFLPSGGPS